MSMAPPPPPSYEAPAQGRPAERWSSTLGFVLATAGSAVGLGNLWGFAYRASQGVAPPSCCFTC